MQSGASRRRGVAPVPKRSGGAGAPDPESIQDIFLERLEALEQRVAAELGRPVAAGGAVQALALDVGRELFYAAVWAGRALGEPRRALAEAALALAPPSTDELGFARLGLLEDLASLFARIWLRAKVELPDGLKRRICDGHSGALLAFNRSPWPLAVEPLLLQGLLARGIFGDRPVHALWDRESLALPFLAPALERAGIVASSPDNCRLLLQQGAVVIGFPEGRAALAKTYDLRYRLARFEDSSLVRAAVEASALIVPAAVVGNEESYPVVARFRGLPLTPLFPWTGLAGLLPLPLAWKLRLGTELSYHERADDGDGRADLADALRGRMQAMLGELVGGRVSIVTG